MYPAELVRPMREDLVLAGFEELHTSLRLLRRLWHKRALLWLWLIRYVDVLLPMLVQGPK